MQPYRRNSMRAARPVARAIAQRAPSLPRLLHFTFAGLLSLMLTSLLAACAVGPSTHLSTLAQPSVVSRDGSASVAARSIIDSLNTARLAAPVATASSTTRMTTVANAAMPTPARLVVDPARDLAWLDVLRDPQLVALVKEAVGNNLDLRVAQSRVREYRAQLGVANSGFLPSLAANGSWSNNKSAFGPNTIQYKAVRATADLSWELDFWGRLRRQSEAAHFDLAERQEDARATTLTLVSEIATAYLQIRELDENVRIAGQTLESRRTTLDLAQRRFRQGVSSELDVRQFEADLADPAVRVADLSLQRTKLENQLSLLLGRAPGAIPAGRPLAEVVQAVSVPDSLPGSLVMHRPDVLSAQRALQASVARVGAAAANRLPTITLGGQYGTQRPDFTNVFAKSGEIYQLQAGISIPLFNSVKLSYDQRAAEARSEQAKSTYEQTVLTALRESNDAMAGVRLNRDQLAAQTAQVQALARAFDLAQERYENGVSSYLDVLDAQRALFSARLSQVQVERQYLVSTVDLYKALGGGWDAAAR